MSIIQMLFLGGKLPVILGPFKSSSTGTRPRVTVINPSETLINLQTALAAIDSDFATASIVNVNAQVWGGGGASGSAYNGTSGSGGGGGYVSGIIPVRDLGIGSIFLRVGGGGGGINTNGGTYPDQNTSGTELYYDQPLDQYVGVNTASISLIGTNSVSSNQSYANITAVGSTSISSNITYSDIISVGSTSIKNTISYEDIISVGSTSIKNTISYEDIVSIGSTSIKNTISYAGITSVGSTSIANQIGYSTITSVGSTSVKNIDDFLPITYIGSVSGEFVTSLSLSSLQNGTLAVGDVVLVASVCDSSTNGDLTSTQPNGYTVIVSSNSSTPKYQISYLRITDLGDSNQTSVQGLQQTIGQGAGGNVRRVAHIASVYRGVNATTILSAVAPSTTGNPDPPIITTTIKNSTVVAFGFIDDQIRIPTDPPVGYEPTPPISQATQDSPGSNATVMSAYRNIAVPGAEDPGTFAAGSTLSYNAVSIVLQPASTRIVFANELTLPTLQPNDIVLVASVADGGTLATPSGANSSGPTATYTSFANGAGNASYRLSWKRMGATPDTKVIGLTATTDAAVDACHIAVIFRGVATSGTPVVTNPTPASTSNGNPDPPSIIADTFNYMSVAFGFVDNNSITGAAITAPTGYTKIITQAVGTNTASQTEATVMSAYKFLSSFKGTEDPGPFAISPNNSQGYAAVTVGLKPQATVVTDASTLPLPVGIATGDIVLLASVSDEGTLITPTASGYTQISSSSGGAPSYQLSWKRMGETPDTSVSGLSNIVTSAGITYDVAHVALVFRGVDRLALNPIVTNATPASSGTTTLDPPSIDTNTINFASVVFGFLDDKSVTTITPPTTPSNYITARNQAVGTSLVSGYEATIMSAYRNLTGTFGVENPGPFTGTNVTGNNFAVTVGLKPQPNTEVDARTLPLPVGITTGDIVLVSSVCNNGTLRYPDGYTGISSSTTGGPSYQLSWKRLTGPDASVSGLTSITSGNGIDYDVAHTATVFRGVDRFAITPYVTATPTTGSTTPDPPVIYPNTTKYTPVVFGFVDNVSDTSITAPTNYEIAVSQAVGTSGITSTQATVVSAYKTVPLTILSEDPGPFADISGTNVAVTVGLKPQPTTVVDARTLPLPVGITTGDIVLVSSVCSNGTLRYPDGYTGISSSTTGGPSYQLSWKRLTGADLAVSAVSGLTSITSGNGIDYDVTHTATVFRGVDRFAITPYVTATPTTGSGNPNPPVIYPNTTKYTPVIFGFVDNVSDTSVTTPVGYTTAIHQAVGTSGITSTQATVVSAYKTVPLTILSEDPGAFTNISGLNAAVTVGLKPQPNTEVDARTLPLPVGITTGDIVLVSSVCSNGTLATPSGYTPISSSGGGGPSYKLSWKRLAGADASVSGLTSITTANGIDYDVAHTATIFRNVNLGEALIFSSNSSVSGNPDPPEIIADTVNYMSVAFGFVDNVDSTSTPVLSGYTASVNQEVGTVGIATIQATVVSAYKNLTLSGSENPNPFTNVSGPNAAVTVGLRPQHNIDTNANLLDLTSISIDPDDIILVSSVSDGGTLRYPDGYTGISSSTTGGPSYQLSWKRLTGTETTVTGLSPTGLIEGSPGAGETAGVAHVATIFRGVTPGANPIFPATPTTGSTTPDPPSVTADSPNCLAVAYGFLDDKSVTTITPPTGYTTAINQAVGTDPNGSTQATIMSAYFTIPGAVAENPSAFTNVSGTYAATTVGLRPRLNLAANTNVLGLPSNLQKDDLILVASVSDGGTLATPPGYTGIASTATGGPSYQLAYKRVGNTIDTQIVGLSSSGVIDSGSSAGEPAGIAHISLVYRGVSTSINPRFEVNTNNNTAPNPPSISNVVADDVVVAFGFLDDVSDTSITPPSTPGLGYTTAVNQTVGSNASSSVEATVMSAYRKVTSSGTEDPGSFGSTSESNVAISLVLRPQVNDKFSIRTGGCGGSSGGYSGIFSGSGSTRIPLLIAGGGGGGGGACVSESLGGFISTAIAGDGGPGGGSIASAGGNGSFVPDGILGGNGYRPFGEGGGGGGDGSTLFGGSAGRTLVYPGIVTTGNPGEAGTIYNESAVSGFFTGGRGANSPYNDLSSIPLYGANSTGGWVRGSGGGSSRTSSGIIPVAVPTDCGGAGGAGYYGGGGGGSGYGGGGGGGGGGSNYISPIVIELANNSGLGTVPGNIDSTNYIPGVGYGGSSVTGSGIADVIGNYGGPGLIILTLTIL